MQLLNKEDFKKKLNSLNEFKLGEEDEDDSFNDKIYSIKILSLENVQEAESIIDNDRELRNDVDREFTDIFCFSTEENIDLVKSLLTDAKIEFEEFRK